MEAHLAEVHALDTFTAKGWTDGRTWAGLSGADNQLDDLVDRYLAPRHIAMHPSVAVDPVEAEAGLGTGLSRVEDERRKGARSDFSF